MKSVPVNYFSFAQCGRMSTKSCWQESQTQCICYYSRETLMSGTKGIWQGAETFQFLLVLVLMRAVILQFPNSFTVPHLMSAKMQVLNFFLNLKCE